MITKSQSDCFSLHNSNQGNKPGWSSNGYRYTTYSGSIEGGTFNPEVNAPYLNPNYDFPDNFGCYTLSAVPILKLLEVAPFRVTIPLMAATFYAPLAHILKEPIVIELLNSDVTQTNEIVSLYQAFFGKNFAKGGLPGDQPSCDWEQVHDLKQSRDFLYSKTFSRSNVKSKKDYKRQQGVISSWCAPYYTLICNTDSKYKGILSKSGFYSLDLNMNEVDTELVRSLHQSGLSSDYNLIMAEYLDYLMNDPATQKPINLLANEDIAYWASTENICLYIGWSHFVYFLYTTGMIDADLHLTLSKLGIKHFEMYTNQNLSLLDSRTKMISSMKAV